MSFQAPCNCIALIQSVRTKQTEKAFTSDKSSTLSTDLIYNIVIQFTDTTDIISKVKRLEIQTQENFGRVFNECAAKTKISFG